MDDSVEMVLGLIRSMDEKLDAIREDVSRIGTDSAARLSGFEAWQRAQIEVTQRQTKLIDNIEERLRVVEQDRVTAEKITALETKFDLRKAEMDKEIQALKEAKIAFGVRDKLITWIGATVISLFIVPVVLKLLHVI